MNISYRIYFRLVQLFLKICVFVAFSSRKYIQILYWYIFVYFDYNSAFLLDLHKNFIFYVKNLEKFFIKQFVNKTREQWQKYKDLYKGKEVVVVACGRTVENYKMIKDAIHIGVNRAFKIPHIKMDYLCYQDTFPEGSQELDAYTRECKRLSGMLPESRRYELKHCDWDGLPYTKENLQDNLCFMLNPFEKDSKYALNIEEEAFCDAEGCVFSALQFIMYTNPKRIYFVGCDCSNTVSDYAYLKVNPTYARQKRSYIKFKDFYEKYYPDTEFVSINPIGLKGIFKDVYTQSYIDGNPELNLLNEDIEIIQG